MSKKEYIQLPVEVKSVEENSLWTVMSTDDEDRHGEKVSQNWNFNNFLKNPIVLNGHQYNDTTETIGRVDVLSLKEHSLEGKIRFAVEENPKAKIIFDLYKGGFLNAFSVGFIPGEENELLELSAVTIPANALALAKAKGIDIGDMEVDYSELTVNQLKDVLKERELPLTGNKKELIGRIEDNDEEVVIEEEKDEQEADESDNLIEETDAEIKELFQEKAGRVLSATSKKKIQSAINALQELLEADSKSYEEEEEEEEPIKKTDIKGVIKALHKELSSTHEDNLAIKKRKIHKALRGLEK